MRTVWKFPLLRMHGWNDVAMGANAEGVTQVVLAAIDPSSGLPCVWIEGDDTGAHMTRSFGVFPTGGMIEDKKHEPIEHVGSLIDGSLVWHIYERTLYYGQDT